MLFSKSYRTSFTPMLRVARFLFPFSSRFFVVVVAPTRVVVVVPGVICGAVFHPHAGFDWQLWLRGLVSNVCAPRRTMPHDLGPPARLFALTPGSGSYQYGRDRQETGRSDGLFTFASRLQRGRRRAQHIPGGRMGMQKQISLFAHCTTGADLCCRRTVSSFIFGSLCLYAWERLRGPVELWQHPLPDPLTSALKLFIPVCGWGSRFFFGESNAWSRWKRESEDTSNNMARDHEWFLLKIRPPSEVERQKADVM